MTGDRGQGIGDMTQGSGEWTVDSGQLTTGVAYETLVPGCGDGRASVLSLSSNCFRCVLSPLCGYPRCVAVPAVWPSPLRCCTLCVAVTVVRLFCCATATAATTVTAVRLGRL